MDADQQLEALLVRLLHHVGERLPARAVVKGGIVLRLLECPRRTNDLDIVLVPCESKRDARPELEKVLEDFPCDKLTIQVSSTAIRARIHQGTLVAQLEVSVAQECPSTPISTASLSLPHRELPRIVRVMRSDAALAHKLAAWLERGLNRDLYDIFWWVAVQKTMPELGILSRRLETVTQRRRKPRTFHLEELCDLLEARLGAVTEAELREELLTSLPDMEYVGLPQRMRGALIPFLQILRSAKLKGS
jgi:predicted nucleotidyltransferase component of viral defense system